MDYKIQNGVVTNFEFAFSDWGTAGAADEHYGGTPVYASGNAFSRSTNKDIFAFGRMAAELYLPESGNLTNLKMICFYDFTLSNLKRLVKTHFLSN